jgi:hypothetical protein
VYLTIKDETKSLLERWASQQGRPIVNLASWIVEKEVARAQAAGEIESEARAISAEVVAAMKTYIEALSTNGCIDILDLQRLADELNIPSEQLAQNLKDLKRKRDKNGAR